ncbi:MAG: nuclear transport factor 2 family protein [Caldilineaceae bacterium]|nr:nuclear transport factor 2 family protein [Caldilineaceae bacterium]HRJ40817.1 nuclear transport factor 2 family protein [Caldilineaceae bacterium]
MTSKNVETVRSAHQAFNAQDFDSAQRLVSAMPQFTDHGRGQAIGTRAEFRSWMESFYEMSSDMQLVDTRYIDAGEWVVAQFRAVGTQDGPMGPFPASGKPYSLDVCELWHFNGDSEADEGHNYSDGLGLAMQLGHLPQP